MTLRLYSCANILLKCRYLLNANTCSERADHYNRPEFYLRVRVCQLSTKAMEIWSNLVYWTKGIEFCEYVNKTLWTKANSKRPYQFNLFGCTWTPRCIQCLNSIRWFTFFMMSMCIYQGHFWAQVKNRHVQCKQVSLNQIWQAPQSTV